MWTRPTPAASRLGNDRLGWRRATRLSGRMVIDILATSQNPRLCYNFLSPYDTHIAFL